MYPQRGTAGTGAVLSLYAVGKQENYLNSKDPKNSFFNPKYLKHTDFSTTLRNHIVQKDPGNPIWPFDKEIRFQINPKTSGDVLSNAFLKCDLPSLSTGEAYCPQVGYAMIKEVRLIIDGATINKVTSDWNILYQELFLKDTETRAFSRTVGSETEPMSPTTKFPLYIPLNLFFCRDRTILYDEKYLRSDDFYKPYLLLCAATQSQIEISITFNKPTFFSNATSTNVTMEDLNLVTLEHTLTDNERLFYKTNKQISLINAVETQSVLTVEKGSTTFKSFLSPQNPVKSIHWFFRNEDFEEENSHENFLNRYNFSTSLLSSNINNENSNVIMSNASFFLGGQQIGFQENVNDNTKVIGHGYYKFLQTFDHHLQPPIRNIYTYSFSISPSNPSPTGAVDFTALTTNNSILQGNIYDKAMSNTYNQHLFYTGYKVLKYENGFASLVFS